MLSVLFRGAWAVRNPSARRDRQLRSTSSPFESESHLSWVKGWGWATVRDVGLLEQNFRVMRMLARRLFANCWIGAHARRLSVTLVVTLSEPCSARPRSARGNYLNYLF